MQNVLITGGARGIGLATAMLAARRGWSVAINYASNDKAAEQGVADLQASGQQAVALRGDVASEEDVVGVFEAAREQIGLLDAVVINAGIVAPSMPLAEMEGSRMQRMLAVNTYGALLCAREAVRQMSRSRGGRGGSIVFVSSMAAKLGSPLRIRGLCCLERGPRYAHDRPGQRGGLRGNPRQCRASRTDRHQHPR